MRALQVSTSRPQRLARFALGSLLLLSAGCGSSSSTSVTAPTSVKCAISVSNTTMAVPAGGGTGNVGVQAARECSWSARADAAWITLSGTSGQGSATLSFSVAGNDRGTPRQAAVIVSDQRVQVVQEAAPCRYEVTPSRGEVANAGGEVVFNLAATGGCPWTATGNSDWISGGVPASGEGSATIRFTVQPNSGGPRSTTVTIANTTAAVDQAGSGPNPAPAPTPSPEPPPPAPAPPPSPPPTPPPACSFAVSPLTKSTSPAGEEVLLSVTAPAGCAWTASTNGAAWITVAAGAAGTGNGSVRLTVAPNTGAARSAVVSVAGSQVTITQAAPAPAACTYSITPVTQNVGRDGGEISVDVRSGDNCSWTAASPVGWITVIAGASGSGNGTVRLAVAANTGPARSATLSIAGQTFTVQEDGQSCTYTLKPTSYNAGRGPDDVLVQVEAPAGCAWTAQSNAGWVTVSEGATGSGSGTVRLLVEANSGAPRTAIITIAGLAFTLTQNGPLCTNTIDPTSRTIGAAGGDVTVTVTAGTGCTWTAASDVPWIAVTQGTSGVGNGSVRLTIGANTGTAPRTGTVQIAGQTFTVQQDPPTACSYSIKPTWYDAGRGPDDFTVEVRTDSGCAWTAISPVSWAVILDGATGTGSGKVHIGVEPNFGDARTATLTIAGLPFTLRQAAR